MNLDAIRWRKHQGQGRADCSFGERLPELWISECHEGSGLRNIGILVIYHEPWGAFMLG